MSYMHTSRIRSSILASIILVAFGALVTAGSAAASGYGELTRFGAPGSGLGKLTEERSRAIGVDPRDNSVYVLDEPQEETERKEEIEGVKVTVVVRHLRLQKFKEESNKTFKAAASVTFEEVSPFWSGEGERSIEGLAVDPAHNRVFALAVDLRKGGLPVDTGAPVAGTLFAYSTVESAKELVPAGQTVEGKVTNVFSGPKELNAESVTAGAALLDPAGITVDPKTGEPIILAHEDHHGNVTDRVENAEDHYVLQRVKSDGTMGQRYVDSTNFFKSVRGEATKPDSPVVTGLEASESLLVNYEGVVKVPFNFAAEAPKFLSEEPQGVGAVVVGAERPEGGAMAVSPEGTLYMLAGIQNAAAGASYSGVYLRSSVTGAGEGWTGGQSPVEGTEDPCVLEPGNEGLIPAVAAGKGVAFVLAPEFLLEENALPAIREFGPGGGGCPTAGAQQPTAETTAGELKEGGSVHAGTSVSFGSKLMQADATSVEWEFVTGSNVEKVTEAVAQYRATKVTHKFEHVGAVTVTETIHTDNLASPLVTEGPEKTKLTFKFKVEASPPVAAFSGPTEVTAGETAMFNGSLSKPSSGSKITKYSWSFGDGSEATTTIPTVSHKYEASGSDTVRLQVTDEAGMTSAPVEHTITVKAKPVEKPVEKPTEPPVEPPVERRGETPGGGVLSYTLSVGGTSIGVTPAGALVLKINCSGQSACTGSVIVRTASPVKSGKRKALVVLATGSFAVAGGHVKELTLHLTGAGKALIKRLHVVKAKATITGRDSANASHVLQTSVTLRLKKH